MRKALRIPCHTIASNAGVDAQEVVTKVMSGKQDFGYDAMRGQFVDMMKSGIIDPTKVGISCSNIYSLIKRFSVESKNRTWSTGTLQYNFIRTVVIISRS